MRGSQVGRECKICVQLDLGRMGRGVRTCRVGVLGLHSAPFDSLDTSNSSSLPVLFPCFSCVDAFKL